MSFERRTQQQKPPPPLQQQHQQQKLALPFWVKYLYWKLNDSFPMFNYSESISRGGGGGTDIDDATSLLHCTTVDSNNSIRNEMNASFCQNIQSQAPPLFLIPENLTFSSLKDEEKHLLQLFDHTIRSIMDVGRHEMVRILTKLEQEVRKELLARKERATAAAVTTTVADGANADVVDAVLMTNEEGILDNCNEEMLDTFTAAPRNGLEIDKDCYLHKIDIFTENLSDNDPNPNVWSNEDFGNHLDFVVGDTDEEEEYVMDCLMNGGLSVNYHHQGEDDSSMTRSESHGDEQQTFRVDNQSIQAASELIQKRIERNKSSRKKKSRPQIDPQIKKAKRMKLFEAVSAEIHDPVILDHRGKRKMERKKRQTNTKYASTLVDHISEYDKQEFDVLDDTSSTRITTGKVAPGTLHLILQQSISTLCYLSLCVIIHSLAKFILRTLNRIPEKRQ